MTGRRAAGVIHILTIAAAYVGAVVGGGFATGREVLHFFSSPTTAGGTALAIAGGGFILGGVALMMLSSRLDARSASELIAAAWSGPAGRRLAGPALGMFYFLILAVVYSASGAVAGECGLSRSAGAIGMAAAVFVCLYVGPGAIRAVNLLLLALLGLTLLSTALELSPLIPNGAGQDASPADPVLYVSYNLIFAMAVFPGLAGKSEGVCLAGAALGGLSLAALCWAEWRIMMEVYRHVAGADVPLRVAVALVRPAAAPLYPLLIAWSLLTTGVAVGCGLVGQRLNRPAGWKTVLLVTVLPLPAAGINLARLVRLLYPPLGWLCLMFWLRLFWRNAGHLLKRTSPV
ncbi:MAG: hypothetical protein R6U70_08930 [Bacillota bacterium]